MQQQLKKQPLIRRIFNEKTKHGVLLAAIGILLLFFVLGTGAAAALGPLMGTTVADILLAFGAAYWLFCWGKDRQVVTGKHWHEIPHIGLWIALIVVLAIVLNVVSDCLATTILHITHDPLYYRYVHSAGTNQHFYEWMAVILAPICEELIYRGWIFNLLKLRFSLPTAAILQAFFFALMHMTLEHFPGTFFLAILNALLYAATGHIWLGMLVHFIYNVAATSIVLLPIPKFLMQLPVSGSIWLVSVAILIYALVLLEKYPDLSRKSVYNELKK